MPSYIIELKVRNDTIQRGPRNGSTFRNLLSTPEKDQLEVWTFTTTDSAATVTSAIEAAVAARGSVGY